MADRATDWFARRTFHHERFADLEALVRAKREQGATISVCVPTLNEEATIAGVASSIRRELMDAVPLVDQLVVMDSRSQDSTAALAAEAGADVRQDTDILPNLPPLAGKGEALWKSLFVLEGDLIVWVDADNERFHPRFVYGLIGPLLADPGIAYVKGFYDRPVRVGTELQSSGGGRVTELVARPLLNMFWPEVGGLIQPLAGEYAGRREVLQALPFLTGYAVEIGMVVDILQRYGVDAIAQVDLDSRVHRNRSVRELSRMAFAVMQAVVRRLESTGRIDLHMQLGPLLYQFDRQDDGYRMESSSVHVGERPPAETLPEYPAR